MKVTKNNHVEKSVWLTNELHQEAVRLAKSRGLTFSGLVREALVAMLACYNRLDEVKAKKSK